MILDILVIRILYAKWRTQQSATPRYDECNNRNNQPRYAKWRTQQSATLRHITIQSATV